MLCVTVGSCDAPYDEVPGRLGMCSHARCLQLRCPTAVEPYAGRHSHDAFSESSLARGNLIFLRRAEILPHSETLCCSDRGSSTRGSLLKDMPRASTGHGML